MDADYERLKPNVACASPACIVAERCLFPPAMTLPVLEEGNKRMGSSRDHAPSITAVTSGQSHTPGPWIVRRLRSGIWNVRGFGKSICNTPTCYRPDAIALNLANATLMAAAPDLLEALQELYDEDGNAMRGMALAGAAIAKATRS